MPLRPPRGYHDLDSPLFHTFNYKFTLDITDATKNSTILPIFRSYEATNAVETIEVNSSHPNYAEDTGAVIHNESIVPKISIDMLALGNEALLVTDNIKHVKFNWMPIYTSFLDSLDASDVKTGADIESLLDLTHNTNNKDTIPNYSGVDLLESSTTADNGAIPLSNVNFATEAFGAYGLTTDAKLESTAFDASTFWKAMRYYSNRKMLQKVTGQWHAPILTTTPFATKGGHGPLYHYSSNNFTYPSVKRGNPYTFCGILVHLPLEDDTSQVPNTEGNTAGSGVQFRLRVQYQEWNKQFDQTPY